MGFSLWYVKIYPSQNHDLSISLERPYKEVLNALINSKIRHSEQELQSFKDPQYNTHSHTLTYRLHV